MEKMNLHKSKLYSLILAGVALISLLLPWMAAKGGLGITVNGFHSWGLLSLIGVGGAAAGAFLMGDKSLPYDDQGKKIALGSFGAITLGAVMFLLRIMTGSAMGVKVSKFYNPGLGLILCLAAGAIGLLLLLGKISVPKSIDDKVK